MPWLWTILVGAFAPPTLVDIDAARYDTDATVLSLESRADEADEADGAEGLSPPGESRSWPEDGPPLTPESPADVTEPDADKSPKRRTSRERGHKVAGIPALRYEPSTGPQFGALLQYVWRPPDSRYNKVGLLFLGHVSTKLLQDYTVELSLRDLFGADEQFLVSGLYIDDPVFPYVGTLEPGEVHNSELTESKLYQSRVRTAGGSLTYFQPVWRKKEVSKRIPHNGRLSVVAGYRMEVDVIDTYAGSLLAFDRPGADGTKRRGSIMGGVAWDARDNEASPVNGGLHDVSVEAASTWTGATSSWYRLNATARWYRPLLRGEYARHRDRFIFAARLGGDALFGDAPLNALGQFGGPFSMVGYGGADVGRGFFRRRFIGDYKFFFTPELRGTPLRFYVLRWTFDVGLNAFVEGGYVFSERDAAELDNFHMSAGGGVYLNWERFFVLRAEVAGAREGVQFYLNAGHAF